LFDEKIYPPFSLNK